SDRASPPRADRRLSSLLPKLHPADLRFDDAKLQPLDGRLGPGPSRGRAGDYGLPVLATLEGGNRPPALRAGPLHLLQSRERKPVGPQAGNDARDPRAPPERSFQSRRMG